MTAPGRVFSSTGLVVAWSLLLLGMLALAWPTVGAMAAFCCALATLAARNALRRLLWRARWMFLAVCVLFAWMTPGMPSFLPGATVDGLLLAAEQLSRLTLSIAMVALLLDRLDSTRLVGGLRGLLRPLGWLGGDSERAVLRLALTLRYLEEAPSDHRWAFTLPAPPTAEQLQPIHLPHETLTLADGGLLAGVLAFLLWVLT